MNLLHELNATRKNNRNNNKLIKQRSALSSNCRRYSRRLLLFTSGTATRLLRRRDGVQKRAEDGKRRGPRAERGNRIFKHRDGREYNHRALGSSFRESVVHSLVHSLVHWSIGPSVHSFVHSLVHWSIGPYSVCSHSLELIIIITRLNKCPLAHSPLEPNTRLS